MTDDNALILTQMKNIDVKLGKIAEDVVYLRGEQIRNEEWHKTLDSDMKEVHEAVHGNGQPGLAKEMKCIDDTMGDINTRLVAIETNEVKKSQLTTVSKLEWLKGWRAVFFTGITVLISTVVTLSIGYYFNTLAR